MNGPLAPAPPAQPPVELTTLHSQINETQSWIANQVERFKSLELDNVANELSALRRDVDVLRDLMQNQRAAQDSVSRSEGAVSPIARALEREHAADQPAEDDDDIRSVSTVMPEPDRDAFEDVEPQWPSNVRPGTPEPVTDESDFVFAKEADVAAASAEAPQPLSPSRPGRSRLQSKRERDEEAARQLEAVMGIARELERQHAEANETIRALQDKVLELEARDSFRALEDKVVALEGRQDAHEERATAVQQALEGVRVEWSSVREDWVSERARISKAMDEFETAKSLAATQLAARPPPSPPKSLTTDSDDASGDLGENDSNGLSRHALASPNKRKKNRRRRSSTRHGESPNDTDPREDAPTDDWERKALLTPSSLSSSSSNPRRFKTGQQDSPSAHNSDRSSIDSLPDVSDKPSGPLQTHAGTIQHNLTVRPFTSPLALCVAHDHLQPIAGTVVVCVFALAIAYGRDLRLVT